MQFLQPTFDSNQNKIVSNSWGGAEVDFGESSCLAISQLCQSASAKGINITVALGDNGSSDGIGSASTSLNVRFPSSSPYVISCGGTSLKTSPTFNEVAWSWDPTYKWGSGGGMSKYFALPSYQSGVIPAGFSKTLRQRLLPDVSTNADPLTPVVLVKNNQYIYMGGTSVVAPTFAGLLARIQPTTFINPILYKNRNKNLQISSSWFRNITSGNNPYYKCSASSYSCVCGIGTVNGQNLKNILANFDSLNESKLIFSSESTKKSESKNESSDKLNKSKNSKLSNEGGWCFGCC